MAKAAGYETVWLSNQAKYGSWGAAVTVLAQEATQQIWINQHLGNTLDTNYFDGELVNRLQEIKPAKRMLIVVHLMGNHNPYSDRYPKAFDRFGTGRAEEYDNSIYYNDDVMHKLLDTVKTWPNFIGFIYFSDHGEDTQKGHDPANFDFDMARIPLYMHFSPAYIKDHPQRFEELKRAQDDVFTNDLIFNTVLGVMGIQYIVRRFMKKKTT